MGRPDGWIKKTYKIGEVNLSLKSEYKLIHKRECVIQILRVSNNPHHENDEPVSLSLSETRSRRHSRIRYL